MDNILRERRLRWLGHWYPYGPPAHTAASTVLAGTRIQERTRSSKSELEEHSQQRPTKDRVHVHLQEAEVAALDRGAGTGRVSGQGGQTFV